MTHTAKTTLALLVEANGIVRFTLTGALEQEGFLVIWASDIEEAVRISQTRRIDLLLVDLNQPRTRGGEDFRRLKAVNPAIPVVLITEQKAAVDPFAAERAGAVLEKPFRVAELIHTMHRLLDQPGHLARQMIATLPVRTMA